VRVGVVDHPEARAVEPEFLSAGLGQQRVRGPPVLLGDRVLQQSVDGDDVGAAEILAQGSQEHELGVDPETGRTIVVRTGRYGPYVTEVLDDEAKEKPRTASLLTTMSPETVTLEDALRLLTLPRTLGSPDGEDVIVTNGRYGPYVRQGKESRSLETEEEMFTITLDEALAKLAEPRTRGRRAATEITLVMPFGTPIPPSPETSQAILAAFAERGIRFIKDNLVQSLDPARKLALLSDGTELPYELFLGVPIHRVPAVVVESGLAARWTVSRI